MTMTDPAQPATKPVTNLVTTHCAADTGGSASPVTTTSETTFSKWLAAQF